MKSLFACLGPLSALVVILLTVQVSTSSVPVAGITGFLPVMMADFEVNRENGDLATVSPVTNKAYLFRYEDLFPSYSPTTTVPPNLTPSMETTVCKTPVSISYKKYDQQTSSSKSFYAVVCTEETTMYLLDASSFTVVATTSIGGLGASNVISSRNPEDPYFYYNYASGHDSVLAAVDIRGAVIEGGDGNIIDRGQVWTAMDSAISADGLIIYIRGPWSPSGFESIQLTNASWEAKSPTFEQVYYDHESTLPYVPDTVGLMTAAGATIYSKTLESEIAHLDFDVACWGKNSTYIFGFWYDQDDYYYYESSRAPISIAAVFSSNFETISDSNLEVPRGFFDVELPEIPRGVQSQADFKRIDFKRELLPLDIHDELIMAYADRISLTPYQCSFAMHANATTILVGAGPQVVHISIAASKHAQLFSSANIELDQLSFPRLPVGATFEAGTGLLVWDPAEDQVGTHELVSSLSFGGKGVCHAAVSLKVTVPSYGFPFEPSHLVINDMETVAVAWMFLQQSSYYYDDIDIESDRTRLSVVYLQEGPILARNSIIVTTDFYFEIEEALVTADRLVVVESPKYGAYKLHVMDITNEKLEQLTTFQVTLPGVSASEVSFSTNSSHLHVKYGKMALMLDLHTFEKKERELYHVASNQNQYTYSRSPFREGSVRNGILYSPISEEPLVLLDPGPFGRAGSYYGSSYYSFDTSWLHEAKRYLPDQPVVAFYKANVCLQLESNSVYGDKYKEAILWVLDWNGNVLGSKTIQAQTEASESQYSASYTVVAARDHAYVSFRDQLFRFSAGEFSEEELQLGAPTGVISMSTNNEKVRFASNQTEFCVRREGRYELHHTVLGGEGPFDFFYSASSADSTLLELDKATGTILLDGAILMERARYSLSQHFLNQGSDAAAELLSAVRKGSEPSIYIDGCLGKSDVPVSQQIGVQAVDQKGDSASVVYQLIIAVPYDEVVPLVTELQANNSSPHACPCACPVPNNATTAFPPLTVESESASTSSLKGHASNGSHLPTLTLVDPASSGAGTTSFTASALLGLLLMVL